MWYLLYNSLPASGFSDHSGCPAGKTALSAWVAAAPGLLPLTPPSDSTRNISSTCIWIHAVSLGEVVAVAPLVRELRRRYPDARLVVTTVTETGREAVEQRLEGSPNIDMLPLDFPWVVNQAIDQSCNRICMFR